MGEIYKIVNDINDKIYIGKSKISAKTRFSSHKTEVKNGDTNAIHNAMRKYGIEHFYFEVLEQVDNNILAEREIYWIQKLNTKVPNGYNIASGGEGGNGTHAKNLEIWRQENPKKVEENYLKLLEWQKNNKESFLETCQKGADTRREKYANTITQAANEASRKKVKCIETGIVYNSVKEAALDIGLKNSAHIGSVCNGKRKTCGGYHWEWVEKEVK